MDSRGHGVGSDDPEQRKVEFVPLHNGNLVWSSVDNLDVQNYVLLESSIEFWNGGTTH
jgi:hypothetical protein